MPAYFLLLTVSQNSICTQKVKFLLFASMLFLPTNFESHALHEDVDPCVFSWSVILTLILERTKGFAFRHHRSHSMALFNSRVSPAYLFLNPGTLIPERKKIASLTLGPLFSKFRVQFWARNFPKFHEGYPSFVANFVRNRNLFFKIAIFAMVEELRRTSASRKK